MAWQLPKTEYHPIDRVTAEQLNIVERNIYDTYVLHAYEHNRDTISGEKIMTGTAILVPPQHKISIIKGTAQIPSTNISTIGLREIRINDVVIHGTQQTGEIPLFKQKVTDQPFDIYINNTNEPVLYEGKLVFFRESNGWAYDSPPFIAYFTLAVMHI